MKTYAVLLVLLMVTLGFAQAPDTLWTRTITAHNNGVLNAVVDLPDGGAMAAGSCCLNLCHFFATAIYAGAISSLGVESAFVQHWGCGGSVGMDAEAYDIKAVPSGGHILLCGAGTADIPLPASLLRLSASGSVMWEQQMIDSTSLANKICVAPGNGFAALTDSASIVRLDSMGNRIWKTSFPGRRLFDIAAASDGGVVAVGADSPERYAFFAVKVAAAGDTVWTRRYPVMLGGWATTARILADGTILIAGTAAIPDAPRQYYGAIVAVDQSGETLWQRSYFEGQNDSGAQPFLNIAGCREGGSILLAGPVPGWAGPFQLVRIDDSGDTLWTRSIPGSGFFRSVIQTSDSGFVVVGHVGSNTFDFQGYMIKFSREGLPVADRPDGVAREFSLSAYPNPFNPSTTLSFTLTKSGIVDLNVFDITGRMVCRLAGGHMGPPLQAGEHQIRFDGAQLPSGLYFARLQNGEFNATQKLLLLK
jgi:hypothetical protein